MTDNLLFEDQRRCYLVGVVVPPAENADEMVLLETNGTHAVFPVDSYPLFSQLAVATVPDEVVNILERFGAEATDYANLVAAKRIVELPELIYESTFRQFFDGIVVVSLAGNYVEEKNDLEVDYMYPDYDESRVTVNRIVYELLKLSTGDFTIVNLIDQVSQGDEQIRREVIAQLLNVMPKLIRQRLIALLSVE